MSDIFPHSDDLDDTPLPSWKRIAGWAVMIAMIAFVAWGVWGCAPRVRMICNYTPEASTPYANHLC